MSARLVIDYSKPGVIEFRYDVSGNPAYTVICANVNNVWRGDLYPALNDGLGKSVDTVAIIDQNGTTPRTRRIDYRMVANPVYANVQDLINALLAKVNAPNATDPDVMALTAALNQEIADRIAGDIALSAEIDADILAALTAKFPDITSITYDGDYATITGTFGTRIVALNT